MPWTGFVKSTIQIMKEYVEKLAVLSTTLDALIRAGQKEAANIVVSKILEITARL